ncbi:MAG: BaiN/RdsA family NAD(P)/FAD-dependent oxidoreductase [Bacteroidota bacterium]
MQDIYSTIVIGGGAAGMIAAWRGAIPGNRVLLLEKNKKPGIKILISGGGKCNITNGSDVRTMLNQFRPVESRFLKYAFHAFTNNHLLDLLHGEGVETYVRENGKVFPVSHDADDVVRALQRLMSRAGVDVRTSDPATRIVREPDGLFTITSTTGILRTKTTVISTGGMSYRKTGTTGDGLRWAETFGHTIVPITPALAPIYLSPVPPPQWQGTPIRDCMLIAMCGSTNIAAWKGDMLFTHRGISGPAALEISKEAFTEFDRGKRVTIHVDFYPEYDRESFQRKLLADIATNINRTALSLAEQLVPQKLASYVLSLSEIDETTKLHQLKKTNRSALAATLKQCLIGTVREIPLDGGEVTAGGIALNEIEQTTMESKIVPGLFLCGEILDIAGPVGGYNLQAAFSTGYVAGEHAGKIAATTGP